MEAPAGVEYGSVSEWRRSPAEPVKGNCDQTLSMHQRLTTPTGVCTVQFRYPAGEKGIPQTGPLTCR